MSKKLKTKKPTQAPQLSPHSKHKLSPANEYLISLILQNQALSDYEKTQLCYTLITNDRLEKIIEQTNGLK